MSLVSIRRRATPLVALIAVLLIGLPAAARAQADGTPQDPAPETAEINEIDGAAWLAGCWRVESPDGRNAAEEQWMAPRGGLMVGMSRSIRGGEARGYELLTIRVAEGRLVYHAVPSGQAPADFPARHAADGRLEFVNSEHDFPQKIAYTRHGDDQVEAAVFGEADGSEPAFVIPYRRVRCPG
jgi:hypothetical protein